ncbi:hypothetical protein [Halomonas llamarensis]|uniref:hypothetical protein n=1 Tax=Halomonas llamarensis TaxID=2945104 RepID=UPI003D33A713
MIDFLLNGRPHRAPHAVDPRTLRSRAWRQSVPLHRLPADPRRRLDHERAPGAAPCVVAPGAGAGERGADECYTTQRALSPTGHLGRAACRRGTARAGGAVNAAETWHAALHRLQREGLPHGAGNASDQRTRNSPQARRGCRLKFSLGGRSGQCCGGFVNVLIEVFPGSLTTLALFGASHARVLSLEGNIGRLAEGMEADFVVLDLATTPLLARRTACCESLAERLFALMMLGDDRVIFETWANGHCQHRR